MAIPSGDQADLASHRGEFRSAVGVVIPLGSLKIFEHCAVSSARVDDACTGFGDECLFARVPRVAERILERDRMS